MLPSFNYHKPQSLPDAYQLLETTDDTALLAGGTDLLVEMKMGVRSQKNIISLNNITELQTISEDSNYVFIGPAANFTQILKSEIIENNIPVLGDAVSQIGSHQVRNSGTIGGNLCTCASCADAAPILIVYDSEIEIGSSQGIRRINLNEFLVYHHKTSLTKYEILTRIIVPKPKSNFFASFLKFGLREASSISVASFAVGLSIDDSVISGAKLVVGACAPTAIICKESSRRLLNVSKDELYRNNTLLNDIANDISNEITPINDIRGTAEFRKEIVKTLAKRAISDAINKSQT